MIANFDQRCRPTKILSFRFVDGQIDQCDQPIKNHFFSNRAAVNHLQPNKNNQETERTINTKQSVREAATICPRPVQVVTLGGGI